MKIETKFDIGQEVWFLRLKQIYKIEIYYISISKDFVIYKDKYNCAYFEEDLFATKSEAEQALKRLERKDEI